jgi:hypothetical protein
MTVARASCSLLLHGTVALLVREVRLRRALQRLLIRLLTYATPACKQRPGVRRSGRPTTA